MRHNISKARCALLFGFAVYVAGCSACFAAVQPGTVDADDQIVIASDNALLATGDMEANRGAAGVTTLSSSQSLAAATSGNSLNVGGNLTNGNIAVGDGMGGFGSYVMNTGNNSTINSAVSFNVQIMTTP